MARKSYYDRYQRFKADGEYLAVPFIGITEYDTDITIIFDKSKMRLDTLSYKYYGSPDYAWLIMLANPGLGSLEYSIPDGSKMRVPYPLDTALSRYETGVTEYLDAKAN